MDTSLALYKCRPTAWIDADWERIEGNHKTCIISIVFSEEMKPTGQKSASTRRSTDHGPHAINIRTAAPHYCAVQTCSRHVRQIRRRRANPLHLSRATYSISRRWSYSRSQFSSIVVSSLFLTPPRRQCNPRGLFVSLRNISKSYERISKKFCGQMGRGLKRSWIHFGGYPDTLVPTGDGQAELARVVG